MITSSDGPVTGREAQKLVRDATKLAQAANGQRGRFDHLTCGDVLRRLIDLHVTNNPQWRFPRK